MSGNIYRGVSVRDIELGNYAHREVWIGLAGRIEDRDGLNGSLRFAVLKDRLLRGDLPDEEIPVVGCYTTIDHVKNMILRSEYPAGIIEEYENKDEVEEFVARYPNWKPAILYFSANPALQDKYPLLTAEIVYNYLRQNKIGTCVFGMVDHETDYFVEKYASTDIAQRLIFREELEQKIKDSICPLVSNRIDSPVMFSYLKAERLRDLKVQVYRKKQMLYSKQLSRKQLIESLSFFNCMIESLDDCSARLANHSSHESSQTDQECVGRHQCASPTEKAKKESARERQENILDEVIQLSYQISNYVMYPSGSNIMSEIQKAAEKINQYIPEIKRMSHKKRKNIFLYVQKCQNALEMGSARCISDKFSEVCREWAEKLKVNQMSNGEKARYIEQKKQQKELIEFYAEQKMMIAAQQRDNKKRVEHEKRRWADLKAQRNLTPAEKQEREHQKEMRRLANKKRKIEKIKAKAEKYEMFRQQKKESVKIEQKQVDIKNEVQVNERQDIPTQNKVYSREVVYILGQQYAGKERVDNINSMTTKTTTQSDMSIQRNRLNEKWGKMKRVVMKYNCSISKQMMYAGNSRLRGR